MAGIWTRAQSLIFGGAIGAAASDAIAPQLEPARQHAWSRNRNRILDPATLARLVAQGAISLGVAKAQAARNGYDDAPVEGLVHLALAGPPVAEALTLRRRNRITDAQLDHALSKAQVERQYWPAIKELLDERLDPAVIATAIQRSIMDAPFTLPKAPPTAVGKVPAFPRSPLDAAAEAAASGIDLERLFVETAIVGNPASPDLAARMTFREIIDRVDFDRAIAEGNTRNEWADVLFEGFRQIVTAHDGIEDHLRGWVDADAMYATTARHGMSKEDTDLLFRITGRPLSFHQAFIGHRRGGELDGPTDQIPEFFLKSLRESNIRPEWYHLAWAQRFSYPAAFVLRGLTESGDLTQAEAHEILLFEGWEPALAEKVSQRWATKKAATGVSLAGKARTSALTALRGSYVDERMEAPEAQTLMTALNVPAAEQTQVLAVWDIERDVRRRGLTATQIKKAIGQPGRDQTWALARLSELGYTPEDAAAFLAE